jgi:hypothetical protein
VGYDWDAVDFWHDYYVENASKYLKGYRWS